MLITVASPTMVYLNEDKAKAVVAQITADETDGYTYAVKSRGPGRFVIEVIDEAGDFIGYL